MNELKLWRVLFVMGLASVLFLSGCGGGAGDGESQDVYNGPNLQGTWLFSVLDEPGGDEQELGLQVINQSGARFTMGGGCQLGSGAPQWAIDGNAVQTSWDYENDGKIETVTLKGTISEDQQTVAGLWSISDGGTWDWRIVKVSESTEQLSQGTLEIHGTFGDQDLDVNSTSICAIVDYCDRMNNDSFFLDDIEINTEYLGGWIGIEIEKPSLLVSGPHTFNIQDGFIVELQGTIVMDAFGQSELRANSGYVTIDSYTGNSIKGSFQLQDEVYDINGSFDVTLWTDDKEACISIK